jgi:hypothetical protein
MMSRLLSGLKYLTGKDVAGRNLHTRPDDTFLVSYPKSGNTWMRFLVANLLRPQAPVTLLEADRLIPSSDGRSRRYFRRMPGPRVIKSHYPFEPSYKRVIYIVRDPRDVAVSQYHYQIKRRVLDDGHPIEEFVLRFVSGDVCPYGSWGENVGSWFAARLDHPGFLFIRYEDLLMQTDKELQKIAIHLSIDSSPELLGLTIARSSADRMRALERQEGGQWASTKGTRSDKFFVRAAVAGGWRSALPQSSVSAIETAWGPLMQWLNYGLTSVPQRSQMEAQSFEAAWQKRVL